MCNPARRPDEGTGSRTRRAPRSSRRVWGERDDPLGGSGVAERTGRRRIGGGPSSETRPSLPSGTGGAVSFGRAMRCHWRIENRLRWVLDVAFREDDSRVPVGNSAASLAVLRHFARNLLHRERVTKGSIATRRFRVALDDAYLPTVLAGVHR